MAFTNYHGIVHGDAGRFNPQGTMTRAMFVQVLYNLEGSPVGDAVPGVPRAVGDDRPYTRFTDVPEGVWYYDAVIWAAESGIVSGVDVGVYAPDSAISRQEMAVMLSNYAEFKGIDIPVHRAMPVFADQTNIASWALAASSVLSEAGVISGSNNEFAPQRTATRAEVAQIFKNFLRLA